MLLLGVLQMISVYGIVQYGLWRFYQLEIMGGWIVLVTFQAIWKTASNLVLTYEIILLKLLNAPETECLWMIGRTQKRCFRFFFSVFLFFKNSIPLSVRNYIRNTSIFLLNWFDLRKDVYVSSGSTWVSTHRLSEFLAHF